MDKKIPSVPSTEEVRKMRVAVVTGNKGFCFYFRHRFPLEVLVNKNMIDALVVDPEGGLEPLKKAVEWADIIVFQNGAAPHFVCSISNAIKESKASKLVVMEFDDDVFNVSKFNPAYRIMGKSEELDKWKEFYSDEDIDISKEDSELRREWIGKAIISSDIVTVTTEELGKAYSSYNSNIVVLPNYIQPKEMPKEKKSKGGVTIGWYGGDSHYADLADIMPVLERIKARYGAKINFHFIGPLFPKLFNRVKAKHTLWTEPHDFYKLLANNAFDIGVIPLLDETFNRRKSNIKWLEMSMFNIPTVTSNVSPYKEDIIHDKTALLYKTKNQLFDNLCDLIDNPLKRAKVSGEAKRHVEKHYDINKKAIDWYKTYSEALYQKAEYLKTI